MKTARVFLLTFLIIISYPILSQQEYAATEPSNMAFCPQGSYQTQGIMDGKNRTINVSVDAFWMSNEITNKEFRAFYEELLNNPEDTLLYIEFKKSDKEDQENSKPKIIKKTITYEKAAKVVIAKEQWNPFDNNDLDGKGYFCNRKYDDYPVVGVTFEGARLYCIWLDEKVREIREKKGLDPIHMYRIPVEAEWEYAAQYGNYSDSGEEGNIHASKKGEKNDLSLRNMNSNVSEWVQATSYMENEGSTGKVIRGGSWKTPATYENRVKVKKGYAANDTGFRIVRSFKAL